MAMQASQAPNSGASQEDLESQPLLKKQVGKGSEKDPETFLDSMSYRPETLSTWSTLSTVGGSIWESRTLWLTMFKLGILAIVVCLTVGKFLPYSMGKYLQAAKLMEITKFLQVFVGLLLGFFLTTSLTRWHACTQGILELCDAIRNLQMQLLSLGVPKEQRNLCLRYALLSGSLLKVQLHMESVERQQMKDLRDNLLEQMLSTEHHQQIGCTQKYTEKELEAIRNVVDPCGLMWAWVTSLIAVFAQDGIIPGMATPTYGRIMNLAQEAHKGILRVRSAISVQAPFVYVHALAYLVHVSNILYALCLGCIGGTNLSFYFHKDQITSGTARLQVVNLEVLFVACFMCVLGPFLHQAIMEICFALSQPFTSDIAPVPVDRLLNLLEEELRDGEHMSTQPPYWERAAFCPKK